MLGTHYFTTNPVFRYVYRCFGRGDGSNSEAVCIEMLLREANSDEKCRQQRVEELPCHTGPIASNK